jgi:hypothetical protein
MNPNTTELKEELKKTLSNLQRLRDEIRVRVHLAGMDAKDQWNKLEPRILDVEREIDEAAEDVTSATRSALNDVIGKLQHLRDSLH